MVSHPCIWKELNTRDAFPSELSPLLRSFAICARKRVDVRVKAVALLFGRGVGHLEDRALAAPQWCHPVQRTLVAGRHDQRRVGRHPLRVPLPARVDPLSLAVRRVLERQHHLDLRLDVQRVVLMPAHLGVGRVHPQLDRKLRGHERPARDARERLRDLG